MKHPQRSATESAIAAKPCPVIFAIGIQPFLRQSYSNPPTSVHFVCFQTDLGFTSRQMCRGNGTDDTMPPP
jgi:hypothetical protein